MKSKVIPFYSNTADNTHCFQANIKMLLKYYFPEEEYGWTELEKITAKVEGLWTWPMAGLMWLAKEKGIEIKVIWKFDFEDFILNGGKYLIRKNGGKIGQSQIDHSDIKQEQSIAKDFIKKAIVVNRTASMEDIESLLDQNYLLIANIDLAVLNGGDIFAGHFILIYSYEKDSFIAHDPGLPAREARKINKTMFHNSWAYSKDSESIMAFKKP